MILAIDPGSDESAYVVYDGESPLEHDKLSNDNLLEILAYQRTPHIGRCTHLAIEMAESFGAKVWGQVFTTVLWTGRFVQAWNGPFTLCSRLKTKTHITGNPRAKDSQVRQCLLERWGGKHRAVGIKSEPGKLYGLTADRWAALAIGVAWWDERADRIEAA